MKMYLLLLFALCHTIVQAQTKSANYTGVITGQVQDDAGQPLAGAIVTASAAPTSVSGARSTTRSVLTNEEGQFRLTGLPSAAYLLSASLPAYVHLPRPGALGAPHYFHDGDSATLTLTKGSVITGRVTNANGEPIPGLNIKATRVRDAAGQATGNASFARRTDDRGVYRIFGLPAGIYIVGTDGADFGWSWNADEQAADAPTYHPASTRDAALELSLQSGQELPGVDIRYRGERGYSVSGKLYDGGTTGGVNIELRQAGARVAATWQSLYRTQPNQGLGFELRGVAAGEYELVAERVSGDDDGAAAAPRRLAVNGADVSGLELRLTPYASVAGKLVLEAPPESKAADKPTCLPARKAAFEEAALYLIAETPQSRAALPATFATPQGAFKIRYLPAGRYRFNAQLPSEAWYLRSITAPDAASKRPLDLGRAGLTLKAGEPRKDVTLTFATGAASLTGKLTVELGAKRPAQMWVHLVPAEKEAADEVLRYAETEAASDGAFALRQLAPGKYWIIARASEATNERPLPLAWNQAERAKLRRAAEAANVSVELQPCQQMKDYALKYAPQ